MLIFLTQVRNYTEVDSNVLSDTLIDQFVRNIELDIANKVDYDDLRAYKTSSCVASQRFLTMPEELMYIRSIQVSSSSTRIFFRKKEIPALYQNLIQQMQQVCQSITLIGMTALLY